MGSSTRGGRLPAAEKNSRVLHESRGVTLRNVAFLVPGYDLPGGMEGQARTLTRGLSELGIPVTVVTTLPRELDLPLREPQGLVEIFRIPTLPHADWSTTLGLFELGALAILRARLRRLNLIYAVHHEMGALAVRLGQALGLPVVVKLASDAFHLRLGSRDLDAMLPNLRQADRVIAISDHLVAEATGPLGIDPHRVVRLDNGVDRTVFRPRPWRPDLPPHVVYLGRLVQGKGLPQLLSAFALLPEALRSTARLQLAGDGPLRAELELQARQANLPVDFLGQLSQDQVLEVLRDAQVLALPSESEGANNAVLQAMATGVPIVASDIPGIRTQVRHDQEGLLVPPADVPALASALAQVLGDPATQERLARAAEARSETFDIEKVALDHVELFEQVAVGRDERPQQAHGLLAPEADPAVLARAGRVAAKTLGLGARSLATALGRRLRG